MNFDPLNYPFSSRRNLVYADNGMVATSQPLAAEAGLEVLRAGGNAIDAAVAAASSLTVLEPTSNGIGGDAFALVWDGEELHGLNSSGPAPEEISIDKLKEKGHEEMPKFGWPPVTVPGAPGGWAKLNERFGDLAFEKVLEPAVSYAEEGYPIQPTLGESWKRAFETYSELEGDQYEHWMDIFAPEGRAPEIGEIWRSEDHAASMKKIAESGAGDFYRGELARKIVEFSEKKGGYLRGRDLSEFEPRWVEPLKVDYRDHQVWELPPNGQGLVALMALNILDGFELPNKFSAETYHKQIESLKLAFADGKEYITDLDEMEPPPERFLEREYAEKRRDLIGDRAADPAPGKPRPGGTVYLAAADGKGNMVSFIQSNYMGFGSGLVVPGTGIALQNRGHIFSLDKDDANCLAPGKRTYHTIIPGFLTRDGCPIGPFGVMGGYMQPQGHLQVLSNCIDFNLNPQAALDAPRWKWKEGRKVELEQGFPSHLVKKLKRRGHEVEIAPDSGGFGRGQTIWQDGDSLVGGTEPRTDGSIYAF